MPDQPEAAPTEPTEPAAPAPPAKPPVSKLWWFTGPVLVVLVLGLVVVASVPVPYYSISPGSARAVEPLLSFEAVDGQPAPHPEAPDDDLLFVTVSTRRPAGIQVYGALRDKTVDLVQQELITGGQSPERNSKYNVQLMTDSKSTAAKVALERAGYEVKMRPVGAVVTDLAPEYPVAKVVHPGDTIIGADGEDITTADELVAVIAGHRPGERVRLTLLPLGATEPVTVEAELAARPEDETKPLLGVTLSDRPEFTFPIEVEIDSGSVGGPSAGLAFTLAILDRLTEGDLTGPSKVAVTGTIRLDGSVGPVGGVTQKTEAAVRAGAKACLVPPDEYADAKRAARGRLRILQVSTVDEALAALRRLGGDPVGAATS
jgi:PDZ domain-containing protein